VRITGGNLPAPRCLLFGHPALARRCGGVEGFSAPRHAAKLCSMHAQSHQKFRGRILAVDDSEPIRLLVQASLESLGYSVEAVETGAAALQAAERETFDAVILDVDMPGLDGTAVGHALRNHPRTSASLIAMHTSLDESEVRSRFDRYDAFLPKPCSPRALGESVDRLVRTRRAEALA
jgi:CheY-like chemotaxis protein